MIENEPEHASHLLELIGHDLNNISGRTPFEAMRNGDMLGTKFVMRILKCWAAD